MTFAYTKPVQCSGPLVHILLGNGDDFKCTCGGRGLFHEGEYYDSAQTKRWYLCADCSHTWAHLRQRTRPAGSAPNPTATPPLNEAVSFRTKGKLGRCIGNGHTCPSYAFYLQEGKLYGWTWGKCVRCETPFTIDPSYSTIEPYREPSADAAD